MTSGGRLSTAYLGAGAALVALYFAFPAGGTVQTVLYEVFGAATVAATLWAVRRYRPARTLPWLLFAAGNLCFVIGDVIFDIEKNAVAPSAADVFYLPGYPLIVAGLLILMFSVGGRSRIAALADAGIVTFAFAVLQWVFVVGPTLRSSGTGLDHRIVSTLYPAMDVVLLAGFVGFFVSPAWRTASFRLLLAAITTLMLGDEINGLANYSYMPGNAVDATFMLSYVLFGAAALHPSMRDLSAPRREPTLRLSYWRIVLVGAALLTAPVILLLDRVQHRAHDLVVVVALEMAISLLVLARFGGILRALERIRLRERTARTLAEEAQWLLAVRNDELVEADRLKDEFVALISHDLRTPLTSIIGYVELALDDGDADTPLDDERRGYLDIVSRSSDRLLRLVDDLLFVARLQSGRLALEPSPVDLAQITAQAVDEARPRAEQKDLVLSFHGDAEVPVEADKGRIFQLLDNLISNAIKFTPEGGRVTVRAAHAPGGALIEVTDTGMGLDTEEVERVFDRFFRSAAAVDRQIQGTGLGLFISRAIAEAHGGRISVTSVHGSGTTFRVELPSRVPPRPGDSPPGENTKEMVA